MAIKVRFEMLFSSIIDFLKRWCTYDDGKEIVENSPPEAGICKRATIISAFEINDIRNDIHLKDGVFDGDLRIEGNNITNLNGLRVINGDLWIQSTSLVSLGELIEVKGDFWLWCYGGVPKIASLGNLEKVGGKLEARSINLTDLGNLRYVGDACVLNGSSVSSLNDLEFVGGDMKLPLAFKYHLGDELTKVKIVGNVSYHSGPNIVTPKHIRNLISFPGNIPPLRDYFRDSNGNEIRTIPTLFSTDSDILHFYTSFKRAFYQGNYYDVCYNLTYVDWLIDDIKDEYIRHKDSSLLNKNLTTIKDYYGFEGICRKIELVRSTLSVNNNNERKYLLEKETITWGCELRQYELFLKRPLMDAEHGIRICRNGGRKGLTKFGKEHIIEITPIFDDLIKQFEDWHNGSFLDIFYSDNLPYKDLGDGQFHPEYYKQFFIDETKYQYYLENMRISHNIWDSRWEGKDIVHYNLVEHAIVDALMSLLRNAENKFRQENGFPRIGEKGVLRERALFLKIKSIFPNEIVLLHGAPTWLCGQHIDIYFSELNIGIEYQGLQHYKPVDYFGGETAHEQTVQRDEKKKKLCMVNHCPLLLVNESTDFNIILKWLTEQIKNRK